MGLTDKEKNVAIGAFNMALMRVRLRDALICAIETVLPRYGGSGAPLSDEEWNEFCRACGNDPEAWGWARIRLNCILAKRNATQPIPTQSQNDVGMYARAWRNVQDGYSVKQPTPPYMNTPNAFVGEQPGKIRKDAQTAPIASVAQADWDDQHGHRSEILPLIGGESVKKEKAAPVDSDLAKKAHSAFMSAPDKPWDAVVRVIQHDRDVRWEKAILTDGISSAGMRDDLILRCRARIEAKPKTLADNLESLAVQFGVGTEGAAAFVKQFRAELAKEQE